ncbi:MAG: glycosyl transferase family 1, partial [Chloroflexi bacterium]
MLVLSDYYPPHYIGGYELICEKVIEGLVDFGYEVCVLTSTHGVEQAQIDGHV